MSQKTMRYRIDLDFEEEHLTLAEAIRKAADELVKVTATGVEVVNLYGATANKDVGFYLVNITDGVDEE